MSNPKPASYHNIHHRGIQIVKELSKVRIAPTIAVKQSILHEAYKVLSECLSSDFISDKSRGTLVLLKNYSEF